jgi:hypothetical protein
MLKDLSRFNFCLSEQVNFYRWIEDDQFPSDIINFNPQTRPSEILLPFITLLDNLID